MADDDRLEHSRPIPRRIQRLMVVATGIFSLALFAPLPSVFAGFADNFQNYPTGGDIVHNSAGVWSLYSPWSDDALVVQDPLNAANHVLNITNNSLDGTSGGSPDIIATFPSIISGAGSVVVSFDMYMAGSNLDSAPQINFGPAAMVTSDDYGHALLLFMDDQQFPTGELLAESSGNPATNANVDIYSTNAWHHVEIDLTNTAGIGGTLTAHYTIDGVLSGTSVATTLSAGGISAVELGAGGTANDAGTFVLIDNLRMVPEPSSITLFGLSAMGLLIAVRRRRRA